MLAIAARQAGNWIHWWNSIRGASWNDQEAPVNDKSFKFSNFPAVVYVAFYCLGNNWFNALSIKL